MAVPKAGPAKVSVQKVKVNKGKRIGQNNNYDPYDNPYSRFGPGASKNYENGRYSTYSLTEASKYAPLVTSSSPSDSSDHIGETERGAKDGRSVATTVYCITI